MFKSSKEYKEIKNKVENILQEKAEFVCLVDSIVEYHLFINKTLHVFQIYSESENYLRKMSVEWLLSLNKVEYFGYIQIKNEIKTEDITYNIRDYVSLN